jgi:hypothetical protein
MSVYLHNKRMLSDCFSSALQASRKCGRYLYLETIETIETMGTMEKLLSTLQKLNSQALGIILEQRDNYLCAHKKSAL